MKITQYLEIEKSPLELNFLNLDINQDKKLFVDYSLIKRNKDNFSKKCRDTVNSFIQAVKNNLELGKTKETKDLFKEMSESNEVCLGYSSGTPKGRGVGDDCAEKIADFIIRENIYSTNQLADIFCLFSDSKIFIEGIKNDRTSDAVISLIKEHLIDYTLEQCSLYSKEVEFETKEVKLWDSNTFQWSLKNKKIPKIDGKNIIFVPRVIINKGSHNFQKEYYRYGVIEKFQQVYLDDNDPLCITRADGTVCAPTKKSLMDLISGDKATLLKETKEDPEILVSFKRKTHIFEPLSRDELLKSFEKDAEIKNVAQKLKEKLENFNGDEKSLCDLRGILENIFFEYFGNKKLSEIGTIYRNYKKFEGIFEEDINFKYIKNSVELNKFILNIEKMGIVIIKEATDEIKEIIRVAHNEQNKKIILISFAELKNLLQELEETESINIEKYLNRKLDVFEVPQV